MSGTPLRAVLFDAGNTLLFLEYARIAAGTAAACGTPLTAAALEAVAAQAARAMEDGTLDERARGARFLQALFTLAGLPPERLPAVAEVLYAMHREKHLLGAQHPGTREALARLRSAGVRLGVISNADGTVEGAIREAGLREFFEIVVDSQAAGVEKPDPRIFRLALEALGVEAGEALYVGDLYEVDVGGARAAGMEAALIDPHGIVRADDVPVLPSVEALVDRLFTDGRLAGSAPAAGRPDPTAA